MKKLFVLFITLNLFSSLFAIPSQAVENNYSLNSLTDELHDVQHLKRIAEHGDAQAQYDLAIYYLSNKANSTGSNKSEIAEYLFEKSAKQGHQEAQYQWAIILQESKNIEAFKWYLKAALQGHKTAQGSLRILIESKSVKIESNQKETVELINKLAEQGEAWAQYQLAKIELSKQNFEKAKEWLEKASQQDYVEAQYELAQVEFKQGNFEKAKEWLEKASLQKHFTSRVKLAWMYFFGQGVKEDREKALLLMRKAAQHFYLISDSFFKRTEQRYWIEIEKSL